MIVTVVGPTASGKSDFALDLAEMLVGQVWFQAVFPGGVEIVGADAFQLYRGLDIGTAKTPESERRGIPHHQIDVLAPHEEASVAAYQRHARADVLGIQTRAALPLVVGGSGLYVRALTDKLAFPPTDPAVRARWQSRLETLGAPALHEVLAERDPAAAGRIDPNNGRRLVRALEVIELTGQPFSASLPDGTYWQDDTLQFYCTRDLADLDARIEVRTRAMFAAGLVEETRGLLADTEHPLGATARKATGYREAAGVLRGELSVAEAIEQTALATRQLSRRQIKWFRRESRLVELAMSSEEFGVLLTQASQQIRGYTHAD